MQLTQSEKISLGTKEIAKRIREQLKQFKGCKFSVTMERFSMGSSITVALMESNIKVIRNFEDMSENALHYIGSGYTIENIRDRQKEGYHQLGRYNLRDDYNINFWCNGVFLTEAGHKLLNKVIKIADQYNYDDSEPQTDYYDVNFSFYMSLGRWDKPYKDGGN